MLSTPPVERHAKLLQGDRADPPSLASWHVAKSLVRRAEAAAVSKSGEVAINATSLVLTFHGLLETKQTKCKNQTGEDKQIGN